MRWVALTSIWWMSKARPGESEGMCKWSVTDRSGLAKAFLILNISVPGMTQARNAVGYLSRLCFQNPYGRFGGWAPPPYRLPLPRCAFTSAMGLGFLILQVGLQIPNNTSQSCRENKMRSCLQNAHQQSALNICYSPSP